MLCDFHTLFVMCQHLNILPLKNGITLQNFELFHTIGRNVLFIFLLSPERGYFFLLILERAEGSGEGDRE